MIKAVIFDFYGVVCADAYSAWQHHFVPDYHRRAEQFAEISHLSDTGHLSVDKFYAQLAAIAGSTPAEVERELGEALKIDRAIIKIVRQVRDKGLKAGLLSNSPKSLYKTLEEFGVQSEFDAILTSEEAGITKPDPRIFIDITSLLKVPHEEVIMIDDLPVNVRGAQEAGLVGIEYETPHHLERALKAAGVPLD